MATNHEVVGSIPTGRTITTNAHSRLRFQRLFGTITLEREIVW
jgi:hypothetical protein